MIKPIDDPKGSATEAGLRYVSADDPGFGRKMHRSGFIFYDTAGKRIRDPGVLKRIRSLVIPPAWTDVWICARAKDICKPLVRMPKAEGSIDTTVIGELSATRPSMSG